MRNAIHAILLAIIVFLCIILSSVALNLMGLFFTNKYLELIVLIVISIVLPIAIIRSSK